MTEKKKLSPFGRAFLLIETLAPYVVTGLSVTDLSVATGIPAPSVCRDMDALAAEGMAQKLESGRWALTARPLRAYRAYDIALRNQQQRQDDFKRNIETGAYRILER